MHKIYKVVMTDRPSSRIIGSITCFEVEHARSTLQAWRLKPEVLEGKRGVGIIELIEVAP